MAAIGRRTEEARRDLADPPRGGGLQELRQRKPGAAVGSRGVLAVVADMRDPQIVLLGGVAVIDLVELGAAVVGRSGALIALGGIILRGCGDDGHARLRERLLQRLERRVDIMRPAIGRGVADRGVIIAGPLHIGDRGIVVGRKAELVVEGAGHCCVSCVSTGRPSRGLCREANDTRIIPQQRILHQTCAGSRLLERRLVSKSRSACTLGESAPLRQIR